MRGQTARLSTSLLAHYAGMRAVSDSKRASGAFRQALRELVDSGVVLEPERGVFAIERDFTRWRELGELNKPGRASGSREQAAGMSERLAAS
jgi:hypothetical protein